MELDSRIPKPISNKDLDLALACDDFFKCGIDVIICLSPDPRCSPPGLETNFFFAFKGGTFDQQTLEEKLSKACFSE